MEFRIAVEAEEDIELARLFYEAEARGLGDRFHADVLATLDHIGLWPKGFSSVTCTIASHRWPSSRSTSSINWKGTSSSCIASATCTNGR